MYYNHDNIITLQKLRSRSNFHEIDRLGRDDLNRVQIQELANKQPSIKAWGNEKRIESDLHVLNP